MSGNWVDPWTYNPWGQPPGEYRWMFQTIFFESATIPLLANTGFKLHISVHEDDADALARVALPTLRLLRVHHKVVRDLETYRGMNTRNQRGKFITIYPGAARPSQRVVDALDSTVGRFRRGPSPSTRQSGHREYEIRVGQSGLFSTYWCQDYAND